MYFVYTNNPKKSITSPIQKKWYDSRGRTRRVQTCTNACSESFKLFYIESLALFQLGPFTTTNTLKFNFHFPNFLNI